MTRRAAEEGSLYQTPDGTWHGSVRFGTGPDGNRIRMHVRAKTKTATAEKLGPASGTKRLAWLTQWLGLTAGLIVASLLPIVDYDGDSAGCQGKTPPGSSICDSGHLPQRSKTDRLRLPKAGASALRRQLRRS